MPKYEFACLNCDSSAEIISVEDPTGRPGCSKCGEFMIRVHTPPTHHIEGGSAHE